MINTFIRYILFSMICLCCGFRFAAAQEQQVMAKLDQQTIRIGDQTKLHLSVVQQAKDILKFPVLTDSVAGKILVLGSSKTDTIPDQQSPGKVTVTKSFVVTGFDEGTYTIPAFEFVTPTGSLKTAELTLVVQSVKVDTTKAIFDIKQPLAVSYTFTDWLKDNWQWVLYPLLGVIVVVALIWYFLKRRKQQPVKEVLKPVIPPHTIALTKLAALKEEKLWQQEKVKEYYSELSDIIREYLEKRYTIKTYEKTTDEIYAALSSGKVEITSAQKNMVHQLLVRADLVKFAKDKPIALENEQSMEEAVQFVSLTTERVKVQAPENTERGQKGELL